MGALSDELLEIAERLDCARTPLADAQLSCALERVDEVATEVARSWSGSWLGYHSRVYYRGLSPAPPNARFSQEWGLMNVDFISDATVGQWEDFDFKIVVEAILKGAGNPDLDSARAVAKAVRREFDEARHEVLSALSTSLQNQDDPFLAQLKEEAQKVTSYTATVFINSHRPKGEFFSRDMVALGQGIQVPPHLSVMADTMAIRSPGQASDELSKIARRAASHLARRERHGSKSRRIGMKVFIGHGRSMAWKDLKDFLQDRLGLGWDEFNRVPVAGISNIARLDQMLDDAAIAFVIMTAEDEQADGKMHARLNVVHEAGLFQGRLGFTRAIILVEEGCEEFSNIHGLGQIRFPKGNISALFEEIRRVLEREEIVQT